MIFRQALFLRSRKMRFSFLRKDKHQEDQFVELRIVDDSKLNFLAISRSSLISVYLTLSYRYFALRLVKDTRSEQRFCEANHFPSAFILVSTIPKSGLFDENCFDNYFVKFVQLVISQWPSFPFHLTDCRLFL